MEVKSTLMQKWNFKITGKIVIPGVHSDDLNIKPENFKVR